MKNKIISGIILICVLACTIIAFHLIFDEHSKLFYITVVTTCIAEVILLSNIPLFSTGRLLTFKNAATSVVVDAYAIILFLWTVIYSLFITEGSDYKALYIGMLLITVVFLVAFGAVELGGGIMQKEEQKQKQSTSQKRTYLLSLDNYWLEVQEILAPYSSDWKDNTLRELKLVIDKISMIPSEKLVSNDSIQSGMNKRLEEIKELLSHLPEDKDECEEKQICITLKIEQFKNYVNTIKSSL